MTIKTGPAAEVTLSTLSNVQRCSCYRIGDEVGMVEESGGTWVPAYAFDQLLKLYKEKQ